VAHLERITINYRIRLALILAPVCLALSLPIRGLSQEASLEFDPTRTQIRFTLGDILHTVHGMFRLKQGTITFNPLTGQTSGLVVVDATSGQSGSNGRDNKMHKSVLESKDYPEITFAPHQILGQIALQGDSQVEIPGVLTVHGGAHEITLKSHVHITGNQLTADIHFSIPYAKWGLHNPSTFILRVNDTVDLDLHAVGQVSPRLTAGIP
jgi:polyisoprenoid-binding protein YceI